MKKWKFAAFFAVAAMAAVPFTQLRAEAVLNALIEGLVDGGNDYNWETVELPGTVCGNGSQYRFFVHDTGSPNVLFLMEGGGACWDYEGCSGRLGILGVANRNGIPADYMDGLVPQYVSPLVNGKDPGLPGRSSTDLVTQGWNVVYLPYCTGDVHVGNKTVTYTDPTGQEPPLVWNHAGYNNTLAAANYTKQKFPNVQKLVITGYSAGGTATSAGYYQIRRIVNPAKGYAINDSGPIHLAPNSNYNSRPLHDTIRAAWDLDTVFDQLPATFDPNDFGSINRMLAQEFPNDQLSYTGYLRDFNYSRYSYQRFFGENGGLTPDSVIYEKWLEDQYALFNELSQYPNYSYFVPWERQLNESHCSTIITFIGAHACSQMEKKRHWWEYLEWPWGQTYKCYSEFVGMDQFLDRFVGNNQQVRIVEPENAYNAEDPGMQIVAPLINGAL